MRSVVMRAAKNNNAKISLSIFNFEFLARICSNNNVALLDANYIFCRNFSSNFLVKNSKS